MPSLLDVDNLFVQYNTDDGVAYAVNGVGFSLERGESLGLVGETGAGKTTLALSILGLLPAQVGQVRSGSITFDGKNLVKQSGSEMKKLRGKRISMIFQDPMTSLNPTKTVGRQIKEVLDLHFRKMPNGEKWEKVDEILQMVGIPPERRNEFPFQFSGGMKQRIIIAMALIGEPELILADEPTTALDVTIQAQILELMRGLQAKFNTSLIFITHDLGAVVEICSRVAVIYSGQIMEMGTVEDVYSRKNNHPYTDGLFKCIPDLKTDALRLTPIDGSMPDPHELPAGCKFYARCTHRKDVCLREEPGCYRKGTHAVKCWLFEEMGWKA